MHDKLAVHKVVAVAFVLKGAGNLNRRCTQATVINLCHHIESMTQLRARQNKPPPTNSVTHIVGYLALRVLGHIIDSLPCIGAVGDAEAKGEVVHAHHLALSIPQPGTSAAGHGRESACGLKC